MTVTALIIVIIEDLLKLEKKLVLLAFLNEKIVFPGRY